MQLSRQHPHHSLTSWSCPELWYPWVAWGFAFMQEPALDEFGVLLAGDNKNGPGIHVAPIPIRQTKEAFSCGVLTNADGMLLNLQVFFIGCPFVVIAAHLVWENRTSPCDRPNPTLDVARSSSSWSLPKRRHLSSMAWKVHRHREWSWVNLRNGLFWSSTRLNFALVSCFLCVVQATQHVGLDTLQAHNIVAVDVPKKMTHIFQPADQYVIAGIKSLVNQAWCSYVESLFSTEEAIAHMLVSNKPGLRAKMYGFLADAIAALSESSILASWEVTGILRAVWNAVPGCPCTLDVISMSETGMAQSHTCAARIVSCVKAAC